MSSNLAVTTFLCLGFCRECGLAGVYLIVVTSYDAVECRAVDEQVLGIMTVNTLCGPYACIGQCRDRDF